MNNIILIGMPGAGKSTVGVVLAKTIGYDFLDTDLLIQSEKQEQLYKIIEQEGIEGFIEIENSIVSRIVTEKTVIATGGSVVFGKQAMQNLKKLGKVIYLKLSVEEVFSRIDNIKTRGIVMSKDKSIDDIYRERTPLYELYADITIDAKGLSLERVVEKIIRELKN